MLVNQTELKTHRTTRNNPLPNKGAQELPPEFDPVTLIRFREMQMRDACPEGIVSCECNDAPGTNVTDNFFLEDGLVNAMITMAGCNPGTR